MPAKKKRAVKRTSATLDFPSTKNPTKKAKVNSPAKAAWKTSLSETTWRTPPPKAKTAPRTSSAKLKQPVSRVKETVPVEKQPPSVFYEDASEDEKLLRKFDLNPAYGPSIGLSRLDRYNRALLLNVDPPPDKAILKLLSHGDDVSEQGLFHRIVKRVAGESYTGHK